MKLIKEQLFPEPVSRTAYFKKIVTGPKLPQQNNPCHDCAVTCGLYTDMAEELTHESEDLQEAVLDTWFCHNDSRKACRGAYNHVHNKNK